MKLTAKGFAIIREWAGKLSQSQVNHLNRIVTVMDKDKSITYPQGAYILATVWHETAGTMEPIAEYGKGRSRDYGRWFKDAQGREWCYKDGFRKDIYYRSTYNHLYYGRGETQNTWFDNYKRLGEALGHDYLNNPDLLLTVEHSTPAMIYAMKVGLYTGHSLSRHINQSKKDYVNARRIINGTDLAVKVAGIANVMERALRAP